MSLAQATVWILGTRLAVFVLPWRTVSAAFDATTVRPGPPDWNRAQVTVWATRAVAKRLLKNRPCLTQALVARHLLRRSGVETTFHLGAARSREGRVEAHAWLEHGSQVVIGGSDSGAIYAPFRPASRTHKPAVAQEGI